MTADPVIHAVVFLADHPTWTWRDLMDTPEEAIDALKSYERSRSSDA